MCGHHAGKVPTTTRGPYSRHTDKTIPATTNDTQLYAELMNHSGFGVIEKMPVAKLVGAAKPTHISVPTKAPRAQVIGGKWLITIASTYEISRPQRKDMNNRTGIAPDPSFIFSSGIPIR